MVETRRTEYIRILKKHRLGVSGNRMLRETFALQIEGERERERERGAEFLSKLQNEEIYNL
jgi:hypothetical protein